MKESSLELQWPLRQHLCSSALPSSLSLGNGRLGSTPDTILETECLTIKPMDPHNKNGGLESWLLRCMITKKP